MKINFLFLFLFLNITSFCQLVIDAGDNGVVCQDMWGITPDTIGGHPTVLNGSGKYSYCWEAYVSKDINGINFNYSASDYLNDTTAANPVIINNIKKNITFYLTVYDSISGLKAYDSVFVYFSSVTYVPIQMTFSVSSLDSVLIQNQFIYMDYPILEYCWTPNTYLADSSSATTISYPKDDIMYSLTVIDSLGCSASLEKVIDINIIETDLSSVQSNSFAISHNPILFDSYIFCRDCYGLFNICIYDSRGRLVLKDVFNDGFFSLDNFTVVDVYYYIISNKSGVYGSGCFIKK